MALTSALAAINKVATSVLLYCAAMWRGVVPCCEPVSQSLKVAARLAGPSRIGSSAHQLQIHYSGERLGAAPGLLSEHRCGLRRSAAG